MNGDITISNIQIEGVNSALDKVTSYIEFTGVDAAGVPVTKMQKMTDSDQLVSSSIGNMQDAIDNLSLRSERLSIASCIFPMLDDTNWSESVIFCILVTGTPAASTPVNSM